MSIGAVDQETWIIDRLGERVLVGDGCWEWTGNRDRKGYGRYGSTPAHRLAYAAWVGPIPQGLHIDHLCRNPSCVRPDHLEPVSTAENTRRGMSGWRNGTKTHCFIGHPFDEANTRHYATPRGTPGRECRTCTYWRNRAQRLTEKWYRDRQAGF